MDSARVFYNCGYSYNYFCSGYSHKDSCSFGGKCSFKKVIGVKRTVPVTPSEQINGRNDNTMKNTGAGHRKKKRSLKERMLYYIDNWLSKGTLPTIILLFVITGLMVFMIAILALMFGGQDSLAHSLWETMNHAFDPGVLSGDTGGKVFLFLMFLATLIGVFFFGDVDRPDQ